MTGELHATREALAFQRSVILSGEGYTETVMLYESDALAEVERAERVITAARELDDRYEEWRHAAGDESLDATIAVMEAAYRVRLALDELDGQTPDSNAAVTERASRADVPCARCGSKPSTETRSLKYGEPWCNVCWDRPLACPCRVHGDPGDCGENCG